MKRCRIGMITMMVAVLVCFLITMGCAKKAVQQGDTTGVQTSGTPQAAVETPKQPSSGETKAVKETPTDEGQAKAEARTTKAADASLEDVRFDFDKSTLSPQTRETLKRHADWLMKNKNIDIVIEGNCDERGTAEYNLALGERRANEAAKYLVGLGIGKERIKTISYGLEKPLDPGHNEDAWAKNRRDSFVLKIK